MGGPYPNDQGNPAGAIPAWEAPPPNLQSANFAADTLGAQLDPNPGVFRGLVVGTAGTASSAILYDGTSAVVTMNLHSPATITWVGHPFQPGDAVFEFRAAGEAEIDDRLGDDVAHALARVERGERVLKHYLHALAHGAELRAGQIVDALAV